MTAIEVRGSFDKIASHYDELWSNTDAGYWQRQAVWNAIHPLFRRGDRVLDIGCGTGVDARSLMAAGVEVLAIDASCEMVRIAQSRGVLARQLAAEELHRLDGPYDGAISNFGVLNCVRDLKVTVKELARLLNRGSRLALCYMGKFCLWETAHYLRAGELRKATRRWSSKAVPTSLGVDIRYLSVREVSTAFAPEFRLVHWQGVGIFVPPSYVPDLHHSSAASLARMDRLVSHVPLLRALSDHRLLILERV